MIKIKCAKCKHVWQPRVENPVECPRCKNYIGLGIKKEGETNGGIDKNRRNNE